MNSRRNPKRRLAACLVLLAGLAVLAVMLPVGGFAFAAIQESRDPFCASCHTQPETTYYERSTGASPADLASSHTGHETRCIDCHSGRGITGRISAELMGARNAFKWYAGIAEQPARLHSPIDDGNCLKCHREVTRRGYTSTSGMSAPDGSMEEEGEEGEEDEGGIGHWHENLARWQASDSKAAACVDCHPGHSTDTAASNGFLDETGTIAVCKDCHRSMEGEDDD